MFGNAGYGLLGGRAVGVRLCMNGMYGDAVVAQSCSNRR